MPTSTDSSLRRQYSLSEYDYRYGFNGKEGDDEIKGDDNQQDYGMRIYDPRVGRFLSVDPIAREYSMLMNILGCGKKLTKDLMKLFSWTI